MSFEYDKDYDLLYVHLSDGEHGRTIEINEEFYVDVDPEDHPLGLEFLSTDAFRGYLAEHGGLNVPDRVSSAESLLTPA